jgi:hypothetical protein
MRLVRPYDYPRLQRLSLRHLLPRFLSRLHAVLYCLCLPMRSQALFSYSTIEYHFLDVLLANSK